MLYLRYWWDLLQAANLLRQVKSKAEVFAVSWKLSVLFVWICSKWPWLFITFGISSTGTSRIDVNLIPPWKLPVPKSDCDAKGHVYHQMASVIIPDTLPAFQWKLSLYSDFLCFLQKLSIAHFSRDFTTARSLCICFVLSFWKVTTKLVSVAELERNRVM